MDSALKTSPTDLESLRRQLDNLAELRSYRGLGEAARLRYWQLCAAELELLSSR